MENVYIFKENDVITSSDIMEKFYKGIKYANYRLGEAIYEPNDEKIQNVILEKYPHSIAGIWHQHLKKQHHLQGLRNESDCKRFYKLVMPAVKSNYLKLSNRLQIDLTTECVFFFTCRISSNNFKMSNLIEEHLSNVVNLGYKEVYFFTWMPLTHLNWKRHVIFFLEVRNIFLSKGVIVNFVTAPPDIMFSCCVMAKDFAMDNSAISALALTLRKYNNGTKQYDKVFFENLMEEMKMSCLLYYRHY